MKETPEEPPITRGDLLRIGSRVIVRALRQVDNRYTRQSDRQAWARIVSSLIANLGAILNEWDMEQLKASVEALEEAAKG